MATSALTLNETLYFKSDLALSTIVNMAANALDLN